MFMTANKYRKRMIEAFHNADHDELIALVVLPKEKEFKFLEWLVKTQKSPQNGKWIKKTKVEAYDIAGVKTWGVKYQCDKCGFIDTVIEDFGHHEYCPCCGTRMQGGGAE